MISSALDCLTVVIEDAETDEEVRTMLRMARWWIEQTMEVAA